VLGKNLCCGHVFPEYLASAGRREKGATVFAYQVRDPQQYGVVEFGKDGRALSLEEKPAKPKSSYAVTGLYFYDNRVLDVAAKLKPSARGELEITEVNKAYLAWGELAVEKLGRGIAWLDTGSHETLLQAANFIQVIEDRQGLKIACVEEIAYKLGYIDAARLRGLAEPMKKNDYGQYLLRLIDGN
jgi:glucose-1-phosphate thymidylyltransferase